MSQPRLPVQPLRDHLATRGALHAPSVVGWRNNTWQVRSWEYANRDGWLTVSAADKLAIDLGLHPAEIWPEWFEVAS